MSLSRTPWGDPVPIRSRLGSQHFVTASDPAPSPGRSVDFPGRLWRSERGCTSQTSHPATLNSRLPCPADILAVSTSLFLGTGLPAPSSLPALYADSENPSALQSDGACPRSSPQATSGFPFSCRLQLSPSTEPGWLSRPSHQRPCKWLHCDCLSLNPAQGALLCPSHHPQRRRLQRRDTWFCMPWALLLGVSKAQG